MYLPVDRISAKGKKIGFEPVPLEFRKYKSCPDPRAVFILMLYAVDNNGIPTNCDEMVHKFLAKVKQDEGIRLNIEGDLTWFLGVRYTYCLLTGAVSAYQWPFIEALLRKNKST